jgi:hypothetical protein
MFLLVLEALHCVSGAGPGGGQSCAAPLRHLLFQLPDLILELACVTSRGVNLSRTLLQTGVLLHNAFVDISNLASALFEPCRCLFAACQLEDLLLTRLPLDRPSLLGLPALSLPELRASLVERPRRLVETVGTML